MNNITKRPTTNSINNNNRLTTQAQEARRFFEEYLALEAAGDWETTYEKLSEVGKKIEFERAQLIQTQISEGLRLLSEAGNDHTALFAYKFSNINTKDPCQFIKNVTHFYTNTLSDPKDSRLEYKIESFKRDETKENLFMALVIIKHENFSPHTKTITTTRYLIHQENGKWAITEHPEDVKAYSSYIQEFFEDFSKKML